MFAVPSSVSSAAFQTFDCFHVRDVDVRTDGTTMQETQASADSVNSTTNTRREAWDVETLDSCGLALWITVHVSIYLDDLTQTALQWLDTLDTQTDDRLPTRSCFSWIWNTLECRRLWWGGGGCQVDQYNIIFVEAPSAGDKLLFKANYWWKFIKMSLFFKQNQHSSLSRITKA